MKVAQKRNAVQEGMFYFRKDIFKGGKTEVQLMIKNWVNSDDQVIQLRFLSLGCNPVVDGTASAQNGLETDGANEEYTLMSINTIINGKVIIFLVWLIQWKT